MQTKYEKTSFELFENENARNRLHRKGSTVGHTLVPLAYQLYFKKRHRFSPKSSLIHTLFPKDVF